MTPRQKMKLIHLRNTKAKRTPVRFCDRITRIKQIRSNTKRTLLAFWCFKRTRYDVTHRLLDKLTEPSEETSTRNSNKKTRLYDDDDDDAAAITRPWRRRGVTRRVGNPAGRKKTGPGVYSRLWRSGPKQLPCRIGSRETSSGRRLRAFMLSKRVRAFKPLERAADEPAKSAGPPIRRAAGRSSSDDERRNLPPRKS